MAKQLPTPHIEVQELNRTTSTVTLKADKQFATEVSRRLKPYKHLPRTFKPALEAVAEYVRGEMIVRTFKQEGPGWAPLRPRTVNERIAKGYSGAHPILRRTGDLFGELTEKSHPKHVEIIKTGKNARIEIGGSSAKFVQNQTGRGDPGQRLAQRSMIPGTGNVPIQGRDREQIGRIIRRSIEREIRRS